MIGRCNVNVNLYIRLRIVLRLRIVIYIWRVIKFLIRIRNIAHRHKNASNALRSVRVRSTVSASFHIFALIGGENVLGEEGNCPGGEQSGGICPKGNVPHCPA